MPNHVTNTIRIYPAEGYTVEDIIDKLKGEDFDDGSERAIDFNNIIPPPENMFTGNLGKHERELCLAEGRPNWYDWCPEHWGTKWNAYSIEGPTIEYGAIELTFDTAWSPPIPIIQALRDWPEVDWVGGNWVEEFCEAAGVF